ncbi:MAG: NAD(P)-dependent alcohol dehydrogenase [Microthrixaceae bacterium]
MTDAHATPHTTGRSPAQPAAHAAPGPDDATEPRPGLPDRMRAVVQRTYGGSAAWRVETVERPTPKPDEVLVEVHAAGLDRGTWHLAAGLPYLVRLGFGLRKPKNPVPGMDLAGRVAAVGTDVTRFAVGEEVFGIGVGTFAEYATAPEAKLVRRPSGLSAEAAAVSTISGITALQALTDVGGLQPGRRVLVLGASGGVGTFAVQLARALGATVDGVAGTRNLELVRSLGAEEVFDYTQQDLAGLERLYDLILDMGGRNSLPRLRKILAPKGTLVIVGGEGGNRLTGGFGRQFRAVALSPFVRQRLTMLISGEDLGSIERLAGHLAAGDVVPAIGSRFPLADAAEALAQMEQGRTSGKSVIIVRPSTDETLRLGLGC